MFDRVLPAKFAVAFSLAGEQRDLILPVAQQVEATLGRSTVFYDDWYEHWLAGPDADLKLQGLYATMADLVVICISHDYDDKPWTRTEYRALRARFMQAPKGELGILPLRVGDGDVDGILFNEIVPDIRKKTVAQAAELIVARLNLARRHADDADPVIARWPSQVPVLQWPMANHAEAREAFGTLLHETSGERALLIQGASETGKSHMSKQMIRNAMALPGVVSARFDFKGTTNIDVEIEAFSRPLGIDPPDGRSLIERLARIFAELRRRTLPTLLVFDTYEAAGEAKEWIERVLLPHLASATWLRVIIAGQSVPGRAGAIWESVAARTLTLQVPGPEHWLEYGRVHRDEALSLDFVAKAHEYADGKANVLASLLGPRS